MHGYSLIGLTLLLASCGGTADGAVVSAKIAMGLRQDKPMVKFHRAPKSLPKDAVTEDWPIFLGPTHNSVSRETRLLKKWPKDGPRLVWEMHRGSGYSSPAIAGSKLVYLHREGAEELIECLKAETGKPIWRYGYECRYRDRFGYNNGPRTSAVISEDRVYSLGVEGKLHCLELDSGELVWKQDLFKKYGLRQNFFGLGPTPLVEGNLLIINVGAPGGPCVVAFDKTDGKAIWKAGNQWGASYATPVPATVHGQRRVFVFTGGESRPPSGGLLCINPVNGEIDFRFPWRSRSYESVNAACPVVIGNQVFITASYKTGGALLNINPDLTHSLAWNTDDLGAHFGTPIEKNGYLYGFDGRNEPDAALVCIELASGKQMWRFEPPLTETYETKRGPTQVDFGIYRGSLVAADGHFLCLGEMGHLLWLDLSPAEARILARTWLFAARHTWCGPVISRGLLYIVQNDLDRVNQTTPRLLCYDLRAEP